jgi:hypothetical protein
MNAYGDIPPRAPRCRERRGACCAGARAERAVGLTLLLSRSDRRSGRSSGALTRQCTEHTAFQLATRAFAQSVRHQAIRRHLLGDCAPQRVRAQSPNVVAPHERICRHAPRCDPRPASLRALCRASGARSRLRPATIRVRSYPPVRLGVPIRLTAGSTSSENSPMEFSSCGVVMAPKSNAPII